jgi:hypothetical protein
MNKYITIIFNGLIFVVISYVVIRVLIETIKREVLPLFNYNIKNKKEYLLLKIKEDPYFFKFANQKLKSDKEVVLLYLDSCKKKYQYSFAFRKVSFTLLNDKEVALKAVQTYGFNLDYLPYKFKDDKSIVMEAILNDSRALEYASERLKNDRETVLLCTIINDTSYFYHSNLKYASVALRSDKQVVMEHVKFDGNALEFASENLQDDMEVVLTAVKNSYGKALQFASEKLRDDWEVVMIACELDKKVIEYASARLKDKINPIKKR